MNSWPRFFFYSVIFTLLTGSFAMHKHFNLMPSSPLIITVISRAIRDIFRKHSPICLTTNQCTFWGYLQGVGEDYLQEH